MRILKAYLMVVALAAPLGSAHAEEAGGAAVPAISSGELARDQGWNGSWALLFDLNNVFMNTETLNMFTGLGIGIEYFANPNTAVRVGFSYASTNDPVVVTKKTEETGGQAAVTTYTGSAPSYSRTSDLKLRADVLYRLSTAAVAPYAGAGLFLGWQQSALSYKDDYTTVNQVTTVSNTSRTLGFGVRGVLGAEWRLHPSFSLVGEYNLDVGLVSQTSFKNATTTEDTIAGERTARRVTNEAKSPSWFNVGTGLTHGGQLGLAVHFM